ncbi:MAG: 2-oxo acid dehydrogenase subunit E2 [Candidatus Sumerlaeia bacterium]|nr:2-oxo acid dehydrogenase subunit E2 [Candidatus Sumerlaeia bacterium]
MPSEAATARVVPILMPQAGNTMEEGTILAWRVAAGDRVAAGQAVLEIETDKATVEVESPAAGRVARLLAQVGAIVPVQAPVALLADDDAEADAWLAANGTGAACASAEPAPAAAAPSAPPPQAAAAAPAAADVAPRTHSGRIKASPLARKLAAARGVNLSGIPRGTGPNGRILAADVETAGASTAAPVRRPLTSMRRAIARNLQTSKQTVPHWYLRLTLDAGPMLDFYRAAKARHGITLNDLVLLAVGRVVHELPEFRSRIEGNELVEIPHSNIGVAVGTDNGLVVPVVCGVERMTLAQLATESRRVVEAARAGKIEGIGKAVFTISNMGMAGVEEFGAIVNPPESGILAVGAIREEVIVRDGAIRAGRVVTMTLSADHRVVDGLVGARFAARLKQLLENPQTLTTNN